MMLENRVTGLFLLSDLSVGCTTDLIQDSAPFALFFSVSKTNLDRCAFAKEGSGSLSLRRSKLTPVYVPTLARRAIWAIRLLHSHCMDIELSIRGRFGERRSDTGQLLLPSGAIGLGRSRIRMWPDSLKLILLVYSTKSPPYSRPLRCEGMR